MVVNMVLIIYFSHQFCVSKNCDGDQELEEKNLDEK